MTPWIVKELDRMLKLRGKARGGVDATLPSFGRVDSKTRVKQKKLLKERVRSVNLLKMVSKLTNEMLFVGKMWSLHVNIPLK